MYSFVPQKIHKMKKITSIIITLFICLGSFAQQVNINGNVAEKNSNSPLGYVSVSLLKNQQQTKGALTNEQGNFTFNNIDAGTYQLRISYIGYKTYERNINISGKNTEVSLEKVFLEEDSKVLKEVEVVGQASQMKLDIDKKVFSVDQSIATAGGNASDVLQNIPSVNVDNDGNVSLRNNSNVEIWINGKPSGLSDENRAQVLEQMPAGNIESVELITNPSAKYSPEGSAGIINLVMKKERKAGYYGSINAGLTATAGSDKIGQIGGASFNFNVGKFDGYINPGARNTFYESETEVDRYYFKNNDTLNVLRQHSNANGQMYGSMTRYGLNYRINDKNTIGVSGHFLIGARDGDSYLNYKKDSSQVILAEYDRDNNIDTKRYMSNTVLDHAIQFNAKTELKSSVAYTTFENDNNALYLQSAKIGNASNINQKQYTESGNTGFEFKSDFSKKITEKNKLELGANIRTQDRISNSETNNYNGSSYVELSDLRNKYEYKEQLYALYATYGMQFNKLSIQAGLRGEYLHTENASNGVSNADREYLQPFPTIFLSYQLPQKNEIQLNYTRRVNRPRGQQLNSFKDVSDSSNIRYGNPNLKPEFTSSLELNHIKNWNNHTLSTSLYYKFTDDVIQQVSFLNNGLMNSTYMNISKSQSSGMELVLKDTFGKFLNLTSTLNLYYYSLIASDFDLSPTKTIHVNGNEDFSWNMRVLANFLFSRTLSGQITGNYSSPKVISQGNMEENYSVDLGLRKSFFDRKFNVALSVKDVFDTRRTVSTINTNNFTQYYNASSLAPEFRLVATYNFGKNNNKKGAKKANREEDNTQEEMDEY